MRAFVFLAFAMAAAAFGQTNFEVLGSLPLSLTNGDVWALGNTAYVGTWRADCPGTGVKIIDISDPRAPRLVATAAGEANTTAEDIVVRRVETASFRGDLMAVGIQICDSRQPGRRGLALWDVTTPSNPRALGFFDTGTASGGVHELDMVVRDGRVLVLLAVVERFVLVDATDPSNPQRLSDWHLTEKLGEPLSGTPPLSSKIVHSALASADGRLAFLSYWDAGVIILDISDVTAPRFLGRTGFDPGEEGNAHSVSVSPDNKLLLTADEDCSAGQQPPHNDFGFLRVFDISDLGRPQQLSIFHSPHSRVDPATGPTAQGNFCIHNPFLVGDLAFLSWYDDGIRAVDLSDPRRPREVGSFLAGEIWGVYVQPEKENMVLASDMRFGLHILRPLRPLAEAAGIVDGAAFTAPVAQGAIVALFGTNMAGATAQADAQPLPRRLAGTTVRVNGNTVPLFYVSPRQINFHLPDETPVGPARVQIENAGRLSAEMTINVAAAAPGIFTLTSDGRGPAAALRASDHAMVGASRPLRAGDFVELFLSGLNNTTAGTAVTIGGRDAEVTFAGRAPGFVGLWQVNARVPAGISGAVAVQVRAGGASSNIAQLQLE